MGSPPHVRGKVDRPVETIGSHGITPACAGKRNLDCKTMEHGRDHPRMCGEKTDSGHHLPTLQGSPPHVRGKVIHNIYSVRDNRITPACAGKSVFHGFFVDFFWDHPRMCGEKNQRPVVDEKPVGITPACAGKRLKRSRSTVPHAAIVPLFPSVCNKPAGSDGSPAGHDAPPFLPIENAAPASPAYNLRSL